jgi:hypothetical protein
MSLASLLSPPRQANILPAFRTAEEPNKLMKPQVSLDLIMDQENAELNSKTKVREQSMENQMQTSVSSYKAGTSILYKTSSNQLLEGLKDLIEQISSLRQKNKSNAEFSKEHPDLDDPKELVLMKQKVEELTKRRVMLKHMIQDSKKERGLMLNPSISNQKRFVSSNIPILAPIPQTPRTAKLSPIINSPSILQHEYSENTRLIPSKQELVSLVLLTVGT